MAEQKSGLRILPLLLAVGSVALVSRAVDLYSGVSVLASSAVAQDAGNVTGQPQDNAPAKPADEQEDDAGQKPDQQEKGDKKPDGDTGGDKGGDNESTQPDSGQGPDSSAPSNQLLDLRSEEELRLVSQIRQRSRELDQREQKLDLQGKLLTSQEKRISEKIDQLKELEQKIAVHLAKFDALENEQLRVVIEIYSKMDAKDAAPRFETLTPETQLALATRMQPRRIAAIMAEMTPEAAGNLTAQLATVVSAPTLDDIDGNGTSR